MPEMKTAVVPSDVVASAIHKATLGPFVMVFLFFTLIWAEIIAQLKGEWSLNPQYGYGWIVPFLALYLIWKRWQVRPSPSPPASRVLPIALMVAGAVLFLPIRFVAEANPDWRLLSWGLALIAVALSLCFIFLVGGRPWLRHFAFPFVFFLVAVPWPAHLEQFVIQNLMRAVTVINVVALNIGGVTALQHGNVIEVGSGFIGIEEACSGVRSLQATLMISLFLGDFYSFMIGRRILLVFAGAILAFFCNLVRTAILVWIGAKRGASAIAEWHDPAGLTILLVCLFGLWLLSLAMLRGSSAITEKEYTGSKPAPLRLSGPWLAALATWILFAEGVTQLWYFTSTDVGRRWVVQWPTSENAYKSAPVPPEAESMLGYNEGGGAAWEGSDGRQWIMYFFRWFPGRTAARFVKVHRPDICLPATGRTMERDDGIALLNVNGVNLPIRSYRFDDRGVPLHVFYCYWDARSSYDSVAAATQEDWTARGRVRAALKGRREIGAQMLELVVWGYEEDADANEALRRQLARVVRLADRVGPGGSIARK